MRISLKGVVPLPPCWKNELEGQHCKHYQCFYLSGRWHEYTNQDPGSCHWAYEKTICRVAGTKKHINCNTATNLLSKNAFQDGMEDLFDIAHRYAMSLMKIEEDRLFLEVQREKGRRRKIGWKPIKLNFRFNNNMFQLCNICYANLNRFSWGIDTTYNKTRNKIHMIFGSHCF